MGHNKVICMKNNVEYLDIRKAMVKGARTEGEVRELPGLCGECQGCRSELPGILSSVCGCVGASLKDVVDTVKNGADTVEKVGELTGAGTDCGRCQVLIQNVINQRR